jgi:hypothetical protein
VTEPPFALRLTRSIAYPNQPQAALRLHPTHGRPLLRSIHERRSIDLNEPRLLDDTVAATAFFGTVQSIASAARLSATALLK